MRPKLKLVPRFDRWGASHPQRAQRQLAWGLYITEGFAANMRAAAKQELSASDREFLKAVENEARRWAFKVRQRLEKGTK